MIEVSRHVFLTALASACRDPRRRPAGGGRVPERDASDDGCGDRAHGARHGSRRWLASSPGLLRRGCRGACAVSWISRIVTAAATSRQPGSTSATTSSVVARALDGSVQYVAQRLAEQARDRGRMEAILAGMVEGVIVVDPQGRLQLVNDAARRMLKLDVVSVGRPYVETIRHPAIAELVAATLLDREPEPAQFSPPRDPSRTIIARAASGHGGAAHGSWS